MADGEENKYHAMSVASFEVFVEQKGMVITFHSSPNLQEFKTIWIQVLSPCAIQVTMWPQRRFIQWRSWSLTITKSTFHHHLPDSINPLQVLEVSSQCPIPIEHPSKPLWPSTIPISDQFMTGSWLNDFQDRASQSWKVTSSFSCEISAQSCFTLPGYLAEAGWSWAAWQQRSSVKIVKIVVCWGPKCRGNPNFYQRLPPATAIDGHDELHERHAPSALSQPYHVVPKRNCHEDIYDHFFRHKKVVHLHQNCSTRSRKTIYASGGWVGKHLGQDILHPCDISKQPPQSKFEPVSRKVAWNDYKL